MKILSDNIRQTRIHKMTGDQYLIIGVTEYEWSNGGRVSYNLLHMMHKFGLIKHAGTSSRNTGPHGDTPEIQIRLVLV